MEIKPKAYAIAATVAVTSLLPSLSMQLFWKERSITEIQIQILEPTLKETSGFFSGSDERSTVFEQRDKDALAAIAQSVQNQERKTKQNIVLGMAIAGLISTTLCLGLLTVLLLRNEDTRQNNFGISGV